MHSLEKCLADADFHPITELEFLSQFNAEIPLADDKTYIKNACFCSCVARDGKCSVIVLKYARISSKVAMKAFL